MKSLQADEELEVWILFDLFNEFFIREPHTGLDDQCSQRHAEGFCWSTKAITELCCIVIFQIIPWDQLGQLDPAVIASEFSSVPVQSSGLANGQNASPFTLLREQRCSADFLLSLGIGKQ